MDFLFKVDFLSFRVKRVEDIFAEQNTYLLIYIILFTRCFNDLLQTGMKLCYEKDIKLRSTA